MATRRNTNETPPSDGESHEDGSDEKELTGIIGNDTTKIAGEMVLRLYADGHFGVEFPKLGLLTLGRVESALPLIYQSLMRARAAAYRVAQGQPEHFVLHPQDVT